MSEADTRRRIIFSSVALFLLTAGFIAIRTGRDALYLQGDGLFGLPKAFIATAAGSIPQAMAMLYLLRKIGPRKTRVLVVLATIAVVGTYSTLAEPGGSALMTAFFFLVPLIFSVAFSMVWLLGTELLEGLDKQAAAKAFARLGAASIVGGVCGGTLARTLGPKLGPHGLLLTGLSLVVATLVLIIVAHRTFAEKAAQLRTEKGEPSAMMDVLRGGGVGLLLGIAMAASITGILVDFQFYLGAVGGDSEQNTVYFANVYLILSGTSLVLQLVVAPAIQRIAGVKGGLMVLPSALLGGAAVVLFMGTVLSRAGLRIAEGSLKSGVHRTSWEQAYLNVPEKDRASAKVLVDGLGARIAEGIAGLGLMGWLGFAAGEQGSSSLSAPWVAEVSAVWITVALIGAALTWAGLSLRLFLRLRRQELPPPSEMAFRAPLPDS